MPNKVITIIVDTELTDDELVDSLVDALDELPVVAVAVLPMEYQKTPSEA